MWISLWFSFIFYGCCPALVLVVLFGSLVHVLVAVYMRNWEPKKKTVCRPRCRLLSKQLIKNKKKTHTQKIYAIGELENSSILKKIKSCSDFHFLFLFLIFVFFLFFGSLSVCCVIMVKIRWKFLSFLAKADTEI